MVFNGLITYQFQTWEGTSEFFGTCLYTAGMTRIGVWTGTVMHCGGVCSLITGRMDRHGHHRTE